MNDFLEWFVPCFVVIALFLMISGFAKGALVFDEPDYAQDAERARGRLTRAQEAYDAFRQEHGVSDLSFERQQAIELAAGLRAQADIARIDAIWSESTEKNAQLGPWLFGEFSIADCFFAPVASHPARPRRISAMPSASFPCWAVAAPRATLSHAP